MLEICSLHHQDTLVSVRLRTKKNEIIIAPGLAFLWLAFCLVMLILSSSAPCPPPPCPVLLLQFAFFLRAHLVSDRLRGWWSGLCFRYLPLFLSLPIFLYALFVSASLSFLTCLHIQRTTFLSSSSSSSFCFCVSFSFCSWFARGVPVSSLYPPLLLSHSFSSSFDTKSE